MRQVAKGGVKGYDFVQRRMEIGDSYPYPGIGWEIGEDDVGHILSGSSTSTYSY